MTVLVLTDPAAAQAVDQVARLVTAARGVGEVVTLAAGTGSRELAKQVIRLDGVTEAWWGEQPGQERIAMEDLAAWVARIAGEFSHVLAAASLFGAEFIPRLGGLLGCQPVTGVVEIRDERHFLRPIHAGAALALVRTTGHPILLTVRAERFAPAPAANPMGNTRQITDIPPLGLSRRMAFLPGTRAGTADPATARVVVAGGGGLETREDFALVEALARALGGAAGASRAAVDKGLAPVSLQIGQTGLIIAPEVYVAVGISGAIQHLAGIKEAKRIAAIDIDPNAPMGRMADVFLAADLRAAIPALLRALTNRT
ncbi:MAG: electron transfer flavoprotein subunit alpha/FixB family protein [Magnetococcales bacterium]|nr:electron transfer flavoprotein subunit alpha/FixB family protein [Magnetococcales bacterium]